MNNLKILVVDDHKLTCRMIAHIIQDFGFDVYTAYVGDEALAILGDSEISVLVTDYELPGMDGVELYQTAKGRDALLRGILCTGRLPMSELSDLVSMGFDDCIPKSLSRDLIGESVARSVENASRWKKRSVQLDEGNDMRMG